MQPERESMAFEACRQSVRRRALANLLLVFLDVAAHSAGRFNVRPFAPDAVELLFRDVRTLVRHGGFFDIAARDFSIALYCPPLWPFDRTAQLVPLILAPDDFCHSNSNGREICVDLAGVLPELLPHLLYDNLRLARFRLDHPVDAGAAAFVRGHFDRFPADPRPLCSMEAGR